MLSEEEYQKAKWQLEHIPTQFTPRECSNLRKLLRHKIKEHEYATRFNPFEPLPHFIYFINRKTTTNILTQILQTATATKKFILDTESIIIPHQPNKPALIQIQILLPHKSSMILLFEMWHLPREYENKFSLIKQLFNIILNDDKIIYIWGSITELLSFTRFNLFTTAQCYLPAEKNFQLEFQKNWQDDHPHQSKITSSNNQDNKCLCETCIGKSPNNTWSLQDAVAFTLQEWLDKRITKSPFDIGLDPELYHMNDRQQEYRKTLVTYAVNDCLSVQRLIIQSELPKPYLKTTTVTTTTLTTTTLSTTTLTTRTQETEDNGIEMISSDDEEPTRKQQTLNQLVPIIEPSKTKQELSTQEKKQIHNRTCTLKQRKRLYQNEIIKRNIDRRFSVTQIKQILRENRIEFSAVNNPTSKLTNKTSLFIGIKNNKELISQYEEKIKHLFTREHYDQIYMNKHYYKSTNHRRHDHKQQHQRK